MRNRFGIRRGEPLAELISRLVAPAAAWSEPKPADDHVLLVALETLAELGDERAVPYLVMALVTVGGVSKVASELLRSRNLPVVAAELAPALQSTLPHVRAHALVVLAANDKWEALSAALERLADADQRVVLASLSILEFWRYFPPNLYSRPTANQRERLRAALRAAPEHAPALSPLIHTIVENGASQG